MSSIYIIHSCANIRANVVVLMSIDCVSPEVINVIIGYIQHPADYFNFRGLCRNTRENLESEFSFHSVEHIVACHFTHDRKTYKKLKLSTPMRMEDFVFIDHSIVTPLSVLDYWAEVIEDSEIIRFHEHSLPIDIPLKSLIRARRDISVLLEKMRPSALRLNPAIYLELAIRSHYDATTCIQIMTKWDCFEILSTRESMLELALKFNRTEVVDHIMVHRLLDVNHSVCGAYPIQVAFKYSNFETTLGLVKWGVRFDAVRYRRGYHPLVHMAVDRNDIRFFLLLVAMKGNLRECDFNGQDILQKIRSCIRSVRCPKLKRELFGMHRYVSSRFH